MNCLSTRPLVNLFPLIIGILLIVSTSLVAQTPGYQERMKAARDTVMHDMNAAAGILHDVLQMDLTTLERVDPLSLLGQIHIHQGNRDSSDYYAERSHKAVIAVGRPGLLDSARYRLGFHYANISDYRSAVDTFLAAIPGLQRYGSRDLLASSYAQLGSAYENLGLPVLAKKYLQLGYELAVELNDTGVLISSGVGLTDYYIERWLLDSALMIVDDVIVKSEPVAGAYQLLPAYGSRVIIHTRQGDLVAAQADQRKIDSLARISPLHPAYTIIKASLEKKLGHVESARALFHAALSDVQAQDDLRNTAEIYYELVTTHLSGTDYDTATYYLNAYNETYKLILEEENRLQALALNEEFAATEREAEISRQQLLLNRRRDQLISLGVLALLALVAGVMLYRLTRRLRRQNAENEQLVAQREALVSEVYHRVKNNLQVVASLLALQSEQLSEGEATDALRASQGRVEAMGLIHERLYGHKNLTSIDMPDYVEDLGNRLFAAYSIGDRVELYTDVEELQLDVDTAMIVGLIISELITNSLKHGFPDERRGTVEASLYHEANQLLVLEIKDDGIGRQAASPPNAATGFGSRLVQLLVDRFDGQITYPAPEQTGHHTRITFVYRENALRNAPPELLS